MTTIDRTSGGDTVVRAPRKQNHFRREQIIGWSWPAVLVFGAAYFVVSTGPAGAACTETGTGEYTCTGDFSSSGLIVQDEVAANTGTVIVNGLTADMLFGEWFPPVSGPDAFALTIDTGMFKVGNNVTDGFAILFDPAGTAGSEGSNESDKSGGAGGSGSGGKAVTFSFTGNAFQTGAVGDDSPEGIFVGSGGGSGGQGGETTCPVFFSCVGGKGGAGGDGNDVTANLSGSVTFGDNSTFSDINVDAIEVASGGGEGGDGGVGNGKDGGINNGGDGGIGGSAGAVTVNSSGAVGVSVTGNTFRGVVARSQGGAGGAGGDGAIAGGSGKAGGNAGPVSLDKDSGSNDSWTVATTGDNAFGFLLLSAGGDGGDGGNGDDGNGEPAGPGGTGGTIESFNPPSNRTISTSGDSSPAFVARSVGGRGADGGSSSIAGKGGAGGVGGGGGDVALFGTWDIATGGADSAGITALSLGGSGGLGGNGTFAGSGGGGGSSGPSGSVEVALNAGSKGITTEGANAPGVLAQSIGGHAGSGGNSNTIVVAFAASGGSAGDAGAVTVNNNDDGGNSNVTGGGQITTKGNQATAIVAQSIGGGGGNGGEAGNSVLSFADFYAQGGTGSIGGAGGAVTVDNANVLTTSGNDASGIVAQSIGGTGGSGGTASAKIIALGGRASDGAAGGEVQVTHSGTIVTGASGDQAADTVAACATGCSLGILAQSIGGGGGNGGSTFSEFSVGGQSGGGGDGAAVTVTNSGDITTKLVDSVGIHAQSIGGGGGRGGGAIAAGPGASISVGGKGGTGGTSGAVTVDSTAGTITTEQKGSHAIWAQSVGGGGGHGGYSFSISGDIELPTLAMAIGADGGGGRHADTVSVTSASAISTSGDDSRGIFAQSVGGGGGNGGMTIAAAISAGEGSSGFAYSVGGSGGAAGDGEAVTVGASGKIETAGSSSSAVFAQSIGGGGGTGGMTISANANFDGDGGADIALGGKGGAGGTGSTVKVDSSTVITATGDQSHGIFAQSVGGGGGAGGMTIAGSLTTSSESQSLGVAIGGDAGVGSTGDDVTVTVTNVSANGPQIGVAGNRAKGIYAQSVGGGGGDGSMTFNGSLSTSSDSQQYNVTLGSNGGDGGAGGTVTVTNAADVVTGVNNNRIFTQAHGVFAQSVGGGGGSGAITGALQLSVTSEDEDHDLNLAMSGSGDGGAGGVATISNSGVVTTAYKNSHALFAQSVGGGGGDADSAYLSLADILLNDPKPSFSTSYLAQGQLGTGNTGGDVTITTASIAGTSGTGSHAVFAQSVGGGGGSSGSLGNPFSDCGNSEGCSSAWNSTVALGGETGDGGDGGDVEIMNSDFATTDGHGSYALFAQSIGAGGGSSGDASALSQAGSEAGLNEFSNLGISLGSGQDAAGASGDGGAVTITQTGGGATTSGIGSTAIYAQSVGAGGGRGGTGAIGQGGTVNVGGAGAAAGDGGDVTVKVTGGSIAAGMDFADADITVASYGIFAQSVGGGGGHAGNVTMGPTDNFGSGLTMNSSATKASGTGGDVDVELGVDLTTSGKDSLGIFAQSVGGGGGIQGEVVQNPTGAQIGSNGGTGVAGTVSVTVSGNVRTSGETAHGVFAQSAGGAGSATAGITKTSVAVSRGVEVSGGGAYGVYAQSSGDGMGAIQVTVDAGATVQGGTSGVGVVVKEGTASTITNMGTIEFIDGADGVAIQSVDSALTINNTGTITGQIVKNGNAALGAFALANELSAAVNGSPRILLTNDQTGVVNSGSLIDVDLKQNFGVLEIGGDGGLLETQFTGDLVTGESGTVRFELGSSLTDVMNDMLAVAGVASFTPGATIEASVLGGVDIEVFSVFELLSATNIVFGGSGDLDDFMVLPEVAGIIFDASIVSDMGMDVLQLATRPVPIPPSVLLFASAFVPFVVIRRRRRRARKSAV